MKLTLDDRVLFSAVLLYHAEVRLRELRAKPCTEKSRGTYPDSAPTEACDIHTPGADLCANCADRVGNLADYKSALRKRAAAKQKLMKWCARIPRMEPKP